MSVRSQIFDAVKESAVKDPEGPLATAFEAEGLHLAPAPRAEMPPTELPVAPQAPPPETVEPPGPAPTQEPPAEPPVKEEPPPQEPASTPGVEAPPAPTAALPPEWDEVEYDDPELGEKLKVYAPREYAPRVKNGYALKAAMSRHATYLGRHKQWLEPLIQQGRFETYAQAIQQIERDSRLAGIINQVLYRYANNMPISLEQQQQTAAAQAPEAAPPEQYLIDPDRYDPYTAEAITEGMRPMMQRLDRFGQFVDQYQAQQAAQTQQQQALQQATALAQQAAVELAAEYPGEFAGDWRADEPKLLELNKYAQDAALFSRYGYSPAAFVIAKQHLDAKRASANGARPGALSPLAEIQRASQAAGNSIAQRVAGSVVNGNPSAPQRVEDPDPLKRIARKNSDGSSRPIKSIARDVAKALDTLTPA